MRNTQKPYNFTTNVLKAYLSAHPSSLSAARLMVAQKPHGRQLNAEVCGTECDHFVQQ